MKSNSESDRNIHATPELAPTLESFQRKGQKEYSNRDFVLGAILEDRYEIVELLGKGGMGSVYKIYNRTVDEFMALKILSSDAAQDSDLVKRFEKETIAVGLWFDVCKAERLKS
jgi:serine/threonine protein kinase